MDDFRNRSAKSCRCSLGASRSAQRVAVGRLCDCLRLNLYAARIKQSFSTPTHTFAPRKCHFFGAFCSTAGSPSGRNEFDSRHRAAAGLVLPLWFLSAISPRALYVSRFLLPFHRKFGFPAATCAVGFLLCDDGPRFAHAHVAIFVCRTLRFGCSLLVLRRLSRLDEPFGRIRATIYPVFTI